MKLVKKLTLLIASLGIGFTSYILVNFQKPFQEAVQVDNFKDWSDYGFDFKIAKEKYVENLKPMPKNINEQIEQDQKNQIKSFSQSVSPVKYLDDQQRETFFWVKDEQIKNSKDFKFYKRKTNQTRMISKK